MAKSKKLNAIDILIIVLVVVAVAVLAVHLVSKFTAAPKTENIQYVVKADNIDTSLCQGISVGDEIFSKDNGNIGTITAVSYSPVLYFGENEDGETVKTEVSDLSTLYITVESDAVYSETGYNINGVNVTIGTEISIYSKNIFVEAECISLQTINSEQ